MSETESKTTDAAESPAANGEIVAYAGRYYRNARYIMAVICFALAGWFAYDGWVKYPTQNRVYDEMMLRGEKPDYTKHQDKDIDIQKTLASTLPLLGIGIIAWLLYNSRGSFRLAGDVLYAPGHPPVPLSAIREIDKTKFDKKGIAYLEYELETADGTKGDSGTIVVDDFVYQQEPMDNILKTIEAKVAPPAEDEPAST
jgi:hypothetical protein